MIKAGELRIGNLAYYELGSDPILRVGEVHEITKHGVALHNGWIVKAGIPLTEDWFPRLGIEEDGYYGIPANPESPFASEIHIRIDLDNQGFTIGVGDANAYLNIQYVHEFQNLIRSLTNKELEIKPNVPQQ